jgi:hypothetical protein
MESVPAAPVNEPLIGDTELFGQYQDLHACPLLLIDLRF